MNPAFSDRTYTAEVMKTASDADEAVKAVGRLLHGEREELEVPEPNGEVIRPVHGFLPSRRQLHRNPRVVEGGDGRKIEIPRIANVRGAECFLYDVLIAQRGKFIVAAVPFHDLAEDFFVRVDKALAGTKTLYRRLDITKMIIGLDNTGGIKTKKGENIAISVTRCHLSYADRDPRSNPLQQIRMTGINLGATKEYKSLIAPIVRGSGIKTVTPLILGFALDMDGVRKSSATTDRHGNFKLWIAPGLRRLTRLFRLLEAIDELANANEAMSDVASETVNVPILQSKSIREAED